MLRERQALRRSEEALSRIRTRNFPGTECSETVMPKPGKSWLVKGDVTGTDISFIILEKSPDGGVLLFFGFEIRIIPVGLILLDNYFYGLNFPWEG